MIQAPEVLNAIFFLTKRTQSGYFDLNVDKRTKVTVFVERQNNGFITTKGVSFVYGSFGIERFLHAIGIDQ